MKSKKKELWYLAAPYSHDDPYVKALRFLQINKVTAHLFNEGYFIFSPISHTHPVREVSCAGDWTIDGGWEFWEEYDTLMLSKCNGIFILKLRGWDLSVGVSAERKIAKKLKLPEKFVCPSTLKISELP